MKARELKDFIKYCLEPYNETYVTHWDFAYLFESKTIFTYVETKLAFYRFTFVYEDGEWRCVNIYHFYKSEKRDVEV